MVRRRPLPLVSRLGATLFGLLIATATLGLTVPFLPDDHNLEEGARATRTLEARHDAQFESAALTRQAREQAAQAVTPVLAPPNAAVRLQQAERLDRIIEQVRSVRQRPGLSQAEQFAELANLAGLEKLSNAGRTSLLALDRATFDAVATAAQAALGGVLERTVQQGQEEERIDEYLAANPPRTAQELTALRELLRAVVVPNVSVDEVATERLRQERAANVAAVVVTYSKGQVVVSEGQVLTPADLEALRATGVIDTTFDYYDWGAGGLFSAMAGLALGLYLYQLQPLAPPTRRRAVLIASATLLALIAVRIAVPAFMPDDDQRYFAFAVPVAAAAMITVLFSTLAFGAVVAAVVGFFAAFIATTAPDLAGASFVGSLESLELAMAYAAAGMAGAVAVHGAERLGRIALAGVPVALATGAVLAGFWLITEPRANENLAWIALAAGISGVGAAVVTIGAYVVLAFALQVPTRHQLMELADSSHPLLRRLQDEAPGTYHHSMMVGALAERAAQRIGADALLARVGAYYHDIGKLARPAYFIENMLDGKPSPHDSLPPLESAAIIRAHVTDGDEIARKHHLPAVVRDFIPQHHGTRLVTFFYRQAHSAGDEPDPGKFRYAGPRPQTKETAIVMLADSCEALVRARRERTREQIDELVDGVFAERLAEGQLDEADITMRELQEVAASFKATLRAVYHPRIEYPQPRPEEIAAMAGTG